MRLNWKAAQNERDETGLYAAGRKAMDRMYEFGAGKWHWKQIGDLELKRISDLVRWKAKNPDHDDPNSPWLEANAIYERRRMPSDLGGKLQISLPKESHPSFQPVKRVSQIPTKDEMEAIAEGWVQYTRSAKNGVYDAEPAARFSKILKERV